MFVYTFDIILLMTCAAAVLYCRLLARRLKALHDLKSGIGEAITNLSGAIKASGDANAQITAQATEALAALDDAILRVGREKIAAEDMLETLDGQVHQAKRTLTHPLAAAEQVADRLTKLTDRSRIEMHALTKAVAITSKVSMLVTSPDGNSNGVKASLHRLSEEVATDPGGNPFRDSVAQTG